MKVPKIFLSRARMAAFFLTAFLCGGSVSCGRQRASLPPPVSGGTPPAAGPQAVSPALAVLINGPFPLWFEFSESGPRNIPSPASAAVGPFAPWPLSRHASALALFGGSLVMAVNRSGFLVLKSEARDRAALYHIAGPEVWPRFSVVSLFPAGDSAAVLFHKDDFFDTSPLILPDPQVLALDLNSLQSEPFTPPALSAFPSREGWDVETLFKGADGRWYFRCRRGEGPEGEQTFFRASSMDAEAEAATQGALRNAAAPRPLPEAPESVALLIETLIKAQDARSERMYYGEIISGNWDAPRTFAGSDAVGGPSAESPPPDGTEKDLVKLSGFWEENAALVINPEGRGFCIRDSETVPRSYTLPPLPPFYVYTGVALVGNTLAASWEEQRDLSVGAAGFMTLLWE